MVNFNQALKYNPEHEKAKLKLKELKQQNPHISL